MGRRPRRAALPRLPLSADTRGPASGEGALARGRSATRARRRRTAQLRGWRRGAASAAWLKLRTADADGLALLAVRGWAGWQGVARGSGASGVAGRVRGQGAAENDGGVWPASSPGSGRQALGRAATCRLGFHSGRHARGTLGALHGAPRRAMPASVQRGQPRTTGGTQGAAPGRRGATPRETPVTASDHADQRAQVVVGVTSGEAATYKRPANQMRLIQHKNEAYFFYMFLSQVWLLGPQSGLVGTQHSPITHMRLGRLSDANSHTTTRCTHALALSECRVCPRDPSHPCAGL